jgi:hypothetical protein
MDRNGYERVGEAFNSETYKPVVSPTPGEGENVPFVTIETDPSVQPALVLNALHRASLLYDRESMSTRGPQLQVVSVQPGSATFQDKATRYSGMRDY